MSELPLAPPRVFLRRMAIKQALPLGLIAVCIWLLHDRVAELDLSGVLQATRDISPAAWLAACVATLVSFYAVGRYDAVIHRLLGSDISEAAARRSGVAAIATSQTTGFGVLIGTLARWRMLPDLSLWQSARVTLAVTVSFLAGLGVVGAMLALWVGSAGPVPLWAAGSVLAGAVAFGAITLWRPGFLLHIALPPLKAQIAILALVALDTAAAACALYVLLPTEILPPASIFYAVFLLALGAGLIGATPGGIGPFEVVCLAFLPTLPEAPLLAAIAGYRVIYYGLPGALAAVLLIAGPRQKRDTAPVGAVGLARADMPMHPGSPFDAMLIHAPRAEAQLLRQGELDLLCKGQNPVALAAATGQSLIVLGDSLDDRLDEAALIGMADRASRDRFLSPCLYKCNARLAVAARSAGWQVTAVSKEAWIDPARHDVEAPAFRQLRRALRKAETAGLRAVVAGAHLPLEEMQTIAVKWAAQRGGARGFSMGQFNAACIARQRVFLCYDAGRRLVGFATFHETQTEWALDLLCQSHLATPGAMQLVIETAIGAAHQRGIARVSLAATPRLAGGLRWMPAILAARIDARSGAKGLTQFKNSFSPTWQPRYLASPTRGGMALGSLDLIDRITRAGRARPGRLPSPKNCLT